MATLTNDGSHHNARRPLTAAHERELSHVTHLLTEAARQLREDAHLEQTPQLPQDHPDYDGGRPFYQISDDSQFVYEAWDRGQRVMHKRTANLRMLLYWIVRDLASSAARQKARQDPRAGSVRDPRQLWFPIWQELIDNQDREWGGILSSEIRDILDAHPYVD